LRSDRPFDDVGIDLDAAVVEKAFNSFSPGECVADRFGCFGFARVRIPLKPAIVSETKPATCSDFIPASIPI